jgi:hypothetical protein
VEGTATRRSSAATGAPSRHLRSRAQLLDQFRESKPQARKLLYYDATNDVAIDMKVRMRQDHTNTDDLAPWDIWTRLLHLVGHMCGRLTENLDPTLSGCLNDRILRQHRWVASMSEQRPSRLQFDEEINIATQPIITTGH